jgi:DNA-binding transcriptional LysR family regulator
VDESWIAGDTRAERTLIASAFEPRIEMVAREWIAKQGLVAAGLGVTMIPSLAVAAARPDLAVVALRDENAPVRSVYVATAPHRTRSPAAVAFAELLKRSAARLRTSLPT